MDLAQRLNPSLDNAAAAGILYTEDEQAAVKLNTAEHAKMWEGNKVNKDKFANTIQIFDAWVEDCEAFREYLTTTNVLRKVQEAENPLTALFDVPEYEDGSLSVKQIQDQYVRGQYKRDGASWDRHFLLKLAQETTNTATEIPEMFKQVLSATGAADQPAAVLFLFAPSVVSSAVSYSD